MSDPFIGEIRAFSFNYAPYGWALCDGTLIPIQQNQALFSILGITFGGNGQTTFGLPNLMGKVPLGCGSGPGLTSYDWGDQIGEASVSLTTNNFPPHSHALAVVANANADQKPVANHYLSKSGNPGRSFSSVPSFQPQPSANTQLAADAVQIAGAAPQAIPHSNLQPYLPVLFCIALSGIYPVRS